MAVKTAGSGKKASRSAELFDEAEGHDAGGNGSGNGAVATGGSDGEDRANLHEIAQTRYLNYALSVITSRALPDVRDGMKPVQRRIIYTMWQNAPRRRRQASQVRHRRRRRDGAAITRTATASIYDALVRMAQPFVMRVPLVEGAGNFGSLDGDPAAAMRYTECRLDADCGRDSSARSVRARFISGPNYDGTKEEPVVLPAKVPNLLINGSAGIAVGMATNIPPHNPGEVCAAAAQAARRSARSRTISSSRN